MSREKRNDELFVAAAMEEGDIDFGERFHGSRLTHGGSRQILTSLSKRKKKKTGESIDLEMVKEKKIVVR